MLQLRAANDLKIDSDLKNHGNYIYERASDPEPAGLGSADYIITMWKRKMNIGIRILESDNTIAIKILNALKPELNKVFNKAVSKIG